MKRLVLSLALPLAAAAVACTGPDSQTTTSAPVEATEAPGEEAETGAPEAAAGSPAAPAPPPAPYEVRGVVDPGIDNLVAFAFKVPQGWRLQQSFTREWNGATPIPQIYLHLVAPDGQQQIEFLPERPYYFADGPTSRSMRQMAAATGAPQSTSPYELAPLPALAYLRRVLLPRLAQRGLHLQATGQHEQALPPEGSARRSSAYVDGRLPNGQLARVECLVSVSATAMNGETYYTWSARPTITQSPSNLAATFAYVGAARASVAFNPAWQQQNQQLTANGQRSNRIETQKRQAIEQDFRNYQKKVYQDVADDRQRSADQRSEAVGDVLRGQAKYEDPTTGQRVRTDDRYNHVYQDRNGALHGSNVPLDAGALNWQELQQVETRNY